MKKIVLVGSPNVGKSVLFNALTKKYVTVSNYPGTTVEVSRGKAQIGEIACQIIDTPGMYSLLPITEEERVARRILLEEKPDLVIHVIDAKNLERMLPLTIQLLESGFPTILVLNIMDEAEQEGIIINRNLLEKELGIPVVGAVSITGEGIEELKKRILSFSQAMRSYENFISYSLKDEIEKIESLLTSSYPLSKRMVALLLLQEDEEIREMVKEREKNNFFSINQVLEKARDRYVNPISYEVALERQHKVREIVDGVVKLKEAKVTFQEILSRLTMNPFTGFPIFLLIIYLLYEFVGVFGAQISVDFLEKTIFGQYINPFVTKIVTSFIPWKVVQDLFVNEYGIITLGIRYAVAIILPIVATFFIAFSIIEDTGYLPRLAMLIDRMFKKIGLNGRAVIPIVLGFGCDTMAVMVTRTLETKRERIIASFLLALAIPCSAQLGVILALLSGNATLFAIWVGVTASIFVLIGYLTSRLMPGENPIFYMEVPPLRLPKLSNVLTKTYTRVEWYLKEVFPLFIMASVFIWIGKVTKLFDLLLRLMAYPVQWIGLPKESAVAFLFGFFRRDFGAAGLFDLKSSGVLSGVPLLVAVITMTLFIPCIAQFSMTVKERGLKTALLMAGFIFPFAFLVGGIVNLILTTLGVSL